MKRKVSIALAAAALVIPLAGCAEAQQAIDSAQAIVGTADALTQACSSASVAWTPGVSVADAQAGLTQASEELSAAAGAGATITGAQQILDALEQSLQELEQMQQAALPTSLDLVETACAAFLP